MFNVIYFNTEQYYYDRYLKISSSEKDLAILNR